jgi:NADPH2:quinone reductase
MATPAAVPTRMKAAAMDRFGPPSVIHTETLPVPKLGKNQVLVRVANAGVGSWDPALADGSFQDVKPRFPRVLGSDGAGTVVRVGSGVERFAVGDRVYGWGFGNPKGGFFAQYAAIDEGNLAAVPASLSLGEAGALAVSGITALQGLEELELTRGKRIVVFGASGGVGHVAVQLAKRLGLRVFAVASKADGVNFVRRLGAEEAAEGHEKTLVRQLREFAPKGLDGALVLAGGRGWKNELELIVRGGAVAWPNGVEPLPIVPKGVARRPYDGESSRAAFDRLNELIARGPFQVKLAKVYPLDATAQALRDVQRHHLGKLAIAVARR